MYLSRKQMYGDLKVDLDDKLDSIRVFISEIKLIIFLELAG